jgi:hypothetical protein
MQVPLEYFQENSRPREGGVDSGFPYEDATLQNQGANGAQTDGIAGSGTTGRGHNGQ